MDWPEDRPPKGEESGIKDLILAETLLIAIVQFDEINFFELTLGVAKKFVVMVQLK